MLLTTRDARIHAQQGDAGRRWNFARFFGCACTHAHSCCFVVDDVIRLTVTRWPSLAFGLMSLIFHAFECGIPGHEALGHRVVLAGSVEWVREPFLGFFHQSSKSRSWPRGGVTFSPHSDLARLRVLRAAVGLSCPFVVAGLDDSSHRLLLESSVAAALPAGPFAGGIMRRATNFWSNLFPPIQGPKASIPWAKSHERRKQ
jgi:hypothetical protein